jgi:hypothetical protein
LFGATLVQQPEMGAISATNWAVVLCILIAATAGLAVVLAVLEYPSRVEHFRRLRRWCVIGVVGAIVGIVAVVTIQSDTSPLALSIPPRASSAHEATLSAVLNLVAASNHIRVVPPNLVPPVAIAVRVPLSNLGVPPLDTGCWPGYAQGSVPACTFGDRNGSRTMVLYGDSHAGMWFQALDDIAVKAHWKLVALTKPSCPAAPLPTETPQSTGEWTACDKWHQFAISRINRIDPDLLVISQERARSPEGIRYTPAQWRRGLNQLFARLKLPSAKKVIIGNIPPARGPDCLAKNPLNVKACSAIPRPHEAYNDMERQVVDSVGGHYIDTTSWFCATKCSLIIGNYDVYFDPAHVAVGYSRYLEGVLTDELDLSG